MVTLSSYYPPWPSFSLSAARQRPKLYAQWYGNPPINHSQAIINSPILSCFEVMLANPYPNPQARDAMQKILSTIGYSCAQVISGLTDIV